MNLQDNQKLLVSFVHGMHEHIPVTNDAVKPTLWSITNQNEEIHSYYFYMDGKDFHSSPYPILGELPDVNATLERHYRFGFTGIQVVGDDLFAGCWNGIYRLDARTLACKGFISNRLTNYIHGFEATESELIFVMPFTDTVVRMDYAGNIIEAFSIDNRLRIEPVDLSRDWRFELKPWAGTGGYFHINHVVKIGNQLHLTSRNLSCFIVIDLESRDVYLRTINYYTPNLIHDGDFADNRFHFTSVDGKLIIVGEKDSIAYDRAKEFHHDLLVESVTRFGDSERNWCRGVAITDTHYYITLDGRYGSDLSFTLQEIDKVERKPTAQKKLNWATVGNVEDIRFVTGFGIAVHEQQQ